jgi:hypothetical protein
MIALSGTHVFGASCGLSGGKSTDGLVKPESA